MPLDDTKIAFGTVYGGIKNYATETTGAITFSGTVAPSVNATLVNLTVDKRQQDILSTLMFNYSGSPNTSSDWKIGTGPITWGKVNLSTSGTVSIETYLSYTLAPTPILTITFIILNPLGVNQTITTPVTATVKAALFQVDYNST